MTKLYPALTGLKAEGAEWEMLAGVRMPGEVSLWIDGKKVADERGEIQIVKDGISGIPVFQLCSQVAAALDAGSQVICELDFLPDWDNEKVEQWMEKYGRDYLQGIVHKMGKGIGKKEKFSRVIKAVSGKDYRYIWDGTRTGDGGRCAAVRSGYSVDGIEKSGKFVSDRGIA